MLYTVGSKYYICYRHYMKVTEGLEGLKLKEQKKYYKIIFIKSGTSHFFLNDKEFVLTGSCAICMNENDKIIFNRVCSEGVKILWFKPTIINLKFTYDLINNPKTKLTMTEYQDLHLIKHFHKDLQETMKIISLHTTDVAGIEYKFHMAKDLLVNQNTKNWPCNSRSYLFEILFCLLRQEEDTNEPQNMLLYEVSSQHVVDIIYYLQSCYNKKITIHQLADIFHTNRTTLMNDFKKYTGKSVNSYLTELRLTMASTLLRDTELRIDEICERTGFNDISYFSKVFKKGLYCTPSEYRRMHNHELY